MRQALVYSCREHKLGRNEVSSDGVRVCCLFDDGSVAIFTKNFTSLLDASFCELGVGRMWKNAGVRSSGIVCHCEGNLKKVVYMSNKFLRDPKLDGIKPYVP